LGKFKRLTICSIRKKSNIKKNQTHFVNSKINKKASEFISLSFFTIMLFCAKIDMRKKDPYKNIQE